MKIAIVFWFWGGGVVGSLYYLRKSMRLMWVLSF